MFIVTLREYDSEEDLDGTLVDLSTGKIETLSIAKVVAHQMLMAAVDSYRDIPFHIDGNQATLHTTEGLYRLATVILAR